MSDNSDVDEPHSPEKRRPKIVDPERFNHSVASRVRTYDCDRQGIVHNAVYLYWLEAGRVEYFREIGLPIDRKTFITKHHFVVAHADIDYLWAAQFDDEYEILTRTTFIRKSSFGMSQIVRLLDGTRLLLADAVLVHLNPATQRPEPIPDSYRNLVRQYEGSNVEIREWDRIGQ